MTVLRVRGRALPEGEWIDLFADGDRWTTDPVPGAELVAEGWLLPGLVDGPRPTGVAPGGGAARPARPAPVAGPRRPACRPCG
ncbi:hypothetical protein AB0J90_01475 [Micromonospora sp. NPDC049523]|uniref:hypothetical protein n=1 Tax=Micromonospora sp. NPDC049523 TaxID=3155921 RepID=UPI003434A100